MPRGRPRKYPVVEEEQPKTIQWLIAEVAHEYCGIPGCTTKLHLQEASQIMDTLKDNGFQIKENG